MAHRSKHMVCLLLTLVMTMSLVQPALAAGVTYMPDVTAEMSRGEYWAALSEDAQEVILTPDCFVTDQTRPFALENGTTLPLRHTLFDNDAIVLTQMAHSIILETDGDRHGVTVTYPQMPYLGLWHCPKTDAPYVCIEPWCSLPSGTEVTVLEEKKDLLSVAPGALYQNHWSIQIHA